PDAPVALEAQAHKERVRPRKTGIRPELHAVHAVGAGPVNGPLYELYAPGTATQGRFQEEAPKHTDPRPRCLWQHSIRATHTPCVVKHHKGASGFNIMRIDIQEVVIGVLKTEAVVVFVIHDVNKGHNGGLILWTGRT